MELSLNQATTRPYGLPETIDAASRAGIKHIGLWIDPVHQTGVRSTVRLLAEAGLAVSSMSRVGFVADKTEAALTNAIDDVRRALDLAAQVGSPMLTFIAGGLPEYDRSIAHAEERVRAALEKLEPHARAAGVRLAIEPLHPLFVQSRSVVSTISSATRLIEDLPPESIGILVDAYATAWDASFEPSVQAAGSRIAGYQVSDFALPLPEPENMNGRLFPGEGTTDLAPMTVAVRTAGYTGPVEVEIFNDDVWSLPLDVIVSRTVDSFERHVRGPVREMETLPA